MAVLLDTSALAKLYHPEIGTDVVNRIVVSEPDGVFVSRLGILEKHSVLSGKVRTGETSTENAELLRRRFRSDVRKRRFRVVALRVRHFQLAETLLAAHGASRDSARWIRYNSLSRWTSTATASLSPS